MHNESKIEVSSELAKELIPILEEQIAKLDNHIVSLQDERESKYKTLGEIKTKLNGSFSLVATDGIKRFRKGEASKLIYNLIRGVPNNAGLELQEIVKRTGIPYSSVFRTLKDPKVNNARFKDEGGKWKIIMI